MAVVGRQRSGCRRRTMAVGGGLAVYVLPLLACFSSSDYRRPSSPIANLRLASLRRKIQTSRIGFTVHA
ncbi:hypothetical protein L1887_08893 [Cichorium endivia]|nr:hypothetical protein L1887_08893 [Cichorium endivia]